MKKVFEKIVEGILTCSGYITSITILLIVAFLFTEAFGLFSNKVIEDGYVLVLNKENEIGKLSSREIKDIFDEEIVNWKEVGGKDLPIKLFRLEDLTAYYSEAELGESYEFASSKIETLIKGAPGIIAFIPRKFVENPQDVRVLEDQTISLKEVFAGTEWFPTATPAPQFGFLPLITGTLWVSFFAILIALPFGLSVSIYMSEIATPRVRSILKPLIELLSGIPSVVYGFFGMVVIVPVVSQLFGGSGKSMLTASILLGIMILPTIIGVSESAINAVPSSYYEGSLALGASHERSVFFATLPAAKSGILAGVILGVGRAIGETMAVIMVAGNQARMPKGILQGVRTMTANIVLEMGYATDLHREALLGTAVVLFVFILIINLSFSFLKRRAD